MRQLAIFTLLAVAAALLASPAQKKKGKHKPDEQEITQVLELPKEPPSVLIADADRLVFHLTPVYSRGLLSQQLHDALKWLLRQDRPLIHLRAFVAGTGDTRRVEAIVSEVCGERHISLPTLTVLQIGALPADGAQVVLEATELERKPVNPYGLQFVAGHLFTLDQPLQLIGPLAEKAIANVSGLFKQAGVGGDDVLAVTCYLTSLAEVDPLRGTAGRLFPRAAISFVQPLRGALQTSAGCEAVGRLPKPAGEGGPAPDFRQSPGAAAVLVGPGRLAFTGAQLAFGNGEGAARLAWQRLAKTLEQEKVPAAGAAVVHIYPLSRAMGELAQKTGTAFLDPAHPPALTVLPFEGLPSMDASFSVDLIAAVPPSP